MQKLFKRINKEYIALFAIFLLAFFVRVYKVNSLPVSLNWDEAAIGYNAYSILKTGKDEWGKFLPLSFRSFGDYKAPLLIYLTVPFVAVFGLSELAVRLPVVLAGSLIAVSSYFLVVLLFDEKKRLIAYLTSFILAISPWQIFFSKGGYEATLSLLFVILGLIFWLLFLQKRDYSLVFSALFLSLSLFSYHSAKVFVPLLLIFLIVSNYKFLRKNIKQILIPGVILLAVFGYLSVNFFSSNTRASGTIILFDQFVKDRGQYLFEIQQEAYLNAINQGKTLSVWLNKRPIFIFRAFVDNYLKNISPYYLVFQNKFQNYRVFLGGISLFTIWEFLLAFFGLFILFKKKKKSRFLILFWLSAAAIAPALSMESPHPIRGMFVLYLVSILSTYGLGMFLYSIYKKFGKKFFSFVFLVVIFLLTVHFYNFAFTYLNKFSSQSAFDWQYGMKQVFDYINNNEYKYKNIYIEDYYGQAYIFYLFYSQKLLNKTEVENNASIIGKFNFIQKTFPQRFEIGTGSLIMVYTNGVIKGDKLVKTINYPNNESLFSFYEIN